jgi:hypothetical protein
MKQDEQSCVASGVRCSICGSEAEWVENKKVYGTNYGDSYMIWLCTNKECRAYVGCHQNTKRPKGTFADRETRKARMLAHQAIDPIWKSGTLPRGEVYRRLKEEFGREIHIGGATKEECSQIVKTAQKITPNN